MQNNSTNSSSATGDEPSSREPKAPVAKEWVHREDITRCIAKFYEDAAKISEGTSAEKGEKVNDLIKVLGDDLIKLLDNPNLKQRFAYFKKHPFRSETGKPRSATMASLFAAEYKAYLASIRDVQDAESIGFRNALGTIEKRLSDRFPCPEGSQATSSKASTGSASTGRGLTTRSLAHTGPTVGSYPPSAEGTFGSTKRGASQSPPGDDVTTSSKQSSKRKR